MGMGSHHEPSRMDVAHGRPPRAWETPWVQVEWLRNMEATGEVWGTMDMAELM